jgi:hypothetical protein
MPPDNKRGKDVVVGREKNYRDRVRGRGGLRKG